MVPSGIRSTLSRLAPNSRIISSGFANIVHRGNNKLQLVIVFGDQLLQDIGLISQLFVLLREFPFLAVVRSRVRQLGADAHKIAEDLLVLRAGGFDSDVLVDFFDFLGQLEKSGKIIGSPPVITTCPHQCRRTSVSIAPYIIW